LIPPLTVIEIRRNGILVGDSQGNLNLITQQANIIAGQPRSYRVAAINFPTLRFGEEPEIGEFVPYTTREVEFLRFSVGRDIVSVAFDERTGEWYRPAESVIMSGRVPPSS
jgi:hypothetical protein